MWLEDSYKLQVHLGNLSKHFLDLLILSISQASNHHDL